MKWTSDDVMEQGSAVALLPFLAAERLPWRWARFTGFLIGSFLWFPFAIASIPWLLVGVGLSMWEASAVGKVTK